MDPFDAIVIERECLADTLGDGLSATDADDDVRRLALHLLSTAPQIAIAILRSSEFSADAHRAAALRGMSLFAERFDCYFERLADFERQPRSSYFSLSMETELLEGYPITVSEFLGEGFDWKSRTATVTGSAFFNAENKGFVYALTCDPHAGAEPTDLLATTMGTLFHWFPQNTTVFRWNDAWSNYFDAGKEWWGTFFWTVGLPHVDRIVVVGASTTD